MMSIASLSNWKQTLESHKRLENIRQVEQENLKMNRALKKLWLIVRRKQNSIRLREQAAEIVSVASDDILKEIFANLN